MHSCLDCLLYFFKFIYPTSSSNENLSSSASNVMLNKQGHILDLELQDCISRGENVMTMCLCGYLKKSVDWNGND